MKRTRALIINDNDLECSKKKYTLEEITLSKVGFLLKDLDSYDLIVYKGSLGEKIIRIR